MSGPCEMLLPTCAHLDQRPADEIMEEMANQNPLDAHLQAWLADLRFVLRRQRQSVKLIVLLSLVVLVWLAYYGFRQLNSLFF